MSAIANYSNKPVDIVCFQGAALSGKKQLSQQLFSEYNSGEVCVGLQKLIQRWLLCLLTVKGSVKFNPNRGTDFLLDIMNAYTYNDVDTIFRLASLEASSQIKEEETEDMPPEECLDYIELLGVEYKEDHFCLNIRVTSEYGDSAPVVLPIVTNPTAL